MIVITDEERHVLRSFYDRLKENIKLERGKSDLVEDSVILTILRTQGSTRDRLIRKSKLTSIEVSPQGLSSLLDKGAIQGNGNFDSYVITAKGAWIFEQETGILNENKFFDYLNQNYFATEDSLPKAKIDLKDKERVLLLAMVAARAFSKDSAVDLKKGDVTRDKWKEILCSSFDLLREMDLIKKEKRSTFSENTGNEHVVVYLFRHNNVQQKTQSVYRYTHDWEYYLDLHNNGVFSQDRLSYIFWKIFNGSISNSQMATIQNYCNDVASKETIYLFDVSKHPFAMPSYDRILKDCLIDSIRAKDRWSQNP